MHGCPNETGKVGRLPLPAALTQQLSKHFPRAEPGSAQRNTHKLGWEYQHCTGQQNQMVFGLNTCIFRNAGIFRLHVKTRSTAQLWSPCCPFYILNSEFMSSSVLAALGTKGFQLQEWQLQLHCAVLPALPALGIPPVCIRRCLRLPHQPTSSSAEAANTTLQGRPLRQQKMAKGIIRIAFSWISHQMWKMAPWKGTKEQWNLKPPETLLLFSLECYIASLIPQFKTDFIVGLSPLTI